MNDYKKKILKLRHYLRKGDSGKIAESVGVPVEVLYQVYERDDSEDMSADQEKAYDALIGFVVDKIRQDVPVFQRLQFMEKALNETGYIHEKKKKKKFFKRKKAKMI